MILSALFDFAKASGRRLTPGLYAWLRSRVNRYERMKRRVIRIQGACVGAGPFKGMQYPPCAIDGRPIPKLIGSYEAELHAVIEQFISEKYRVVINVGCAEGYYAVGLAYALPQTWVIGFDMAHRARLACMNLAHLNGVSDRVAVAGTCSAERLACLPIHGALIICDCEGAELEILDPAKAPGLYGSTMLVELHDCFRPGLTERLIARFGGSHRITIIDASPRKAEDYPVLAGFSPPDQLEVLDEKRILDGKPIRQQWAVMRPKAAPVEHASA